jgi:parallel beta-helix repeat protein
LDGLSPQENSIVITRRSFWFSPTPLAALLLAAILPSTASGKVIQVPGQQPTIQDGINAASNGDVVQVSPGTYTEDINFNGKAITVMSLNGPQTTIIDGNHSASVVTFNSGETVASILKGFTIQNGAATSSSYDGGGVAISNASPTVEGNIIQNNVACDGGAGVYVDFSSAVIKRNIINNNSQQGCSGGIGGAGVAVAGAASAQVIGNTIENNTWGSAGGSMTLFSAGTPTIMNNVIAGNTASGAQGGGIWLVNSENELLIQNLVYGNSASEGAGIYISIPSGSIGPLLVNNTVANNLLSSTGSALYATGFDNQVMLFNNIFVGASGQNAVYCDSTYDQQPPQLISNDAFSAHGTGLLGTCASEGGTNGNISANPRFVNPAKNHYQLKAGSPAINAGDNNAPHLPHKDLAGHRRIQGSTVDMGVYEF